MGVGEKLSSLHASHHIPAPHSLLASPLWCEPPQVPGSLSHASNSLG